MQFSAALLISALSLSASAVTINKARQSAPIPSYSVGIVTSDGATQALQSDANGQVFQAFYPTTGPYLTHAEIDNANPPNSASCVTRDQWGNQVRGFGGPQFGNVNAVDFVEADGKQVYTISCFPAY